MKTPHLLVAFVVIAGTRWVMMREIHASIREDVKLKHADYFASVEGLLFSEPPSARKSSKKRSKSKKTKDTKEGKLEDMPEVASSSTTDNGKPNLVFHIGLYKTATTTLQTDLKRFLKVLEKDNYHYAGRYYDPYHNGKRIMVNRSSTDLADAATEMFWHCDVEPHTAACMEDFLTELKPFKRKGTNVLISDESHSKFFGEREFRIIDEVLSKDWNVVVVVGYRRFFEWLNSVNFQAIRMNRHVSWKEEWPHHEDSAGREPELLFPNLAKNWQDPATTEGMNRFIPFFQNVTKDTGLDLRILNIHDADKGSVRTNFLCNMIPGARKACKTSRKRDKKEAETKMNDSTLIIHVNYDLVVTAAAAAGMIDSQKYSRWDMRYALGDYAAEHNLGPFDFDMTCPSEAELKDFYQESLLLEKEVFKETHTAFQEKEHRDAFMDRLRTKEYCRPNIKKVLKDDRWTPFFKKYAS